MHVQTPTNPPIDTGPSETSEERCNDLAAYFLSKVTDIYSCFKMNGDLTEVCDEEQEIVPPQQAITNFPLMEQNGVEALMEKVKSGSPLDPAPPQILRTVTPVILPTLMRVMNHSQETGIVPVAWKHAVIKPLPKKANAHRSQLGNFCPISLLPFVGKLLEKHVNRTLSEFLETNQCLHPTQMGFRAQHRICFVSGGGGSKTIVRPG